MTRFYAIGMAAVGALLGCGRSPVASPAPTAPAAYEAPDPLRLAGQVGLELINAKGQQIRSRAEVYEAQVFAVKLRAASAEAHGCKGQGTPQSVVESPTGTQFELTIENVSDEPFIPHLIEYREDGLFIEDLVDHVAPGKTLSMCVAAGKPGDILMRVVGTREPQILEDTVMYQAARTIAWESPDNVQAKALTTLLNNENRQRLTLARLLHAHGQPLPAEMVLGRVHAPGEGGAPPREAFALPPEAGLLVYAEVEGALMAAWYEAGRPAVATRLELSPSEIDPLTDGMVVALAGGNAVSRSPAPRGLLRAPPEVPPASSAAVASAVLPRVVQERLGVVDSLVIVPTRSLGRLPWFALEVDGQPFVASHSVTVAPDLVALADAPPAWSAEFSSPLIVGDPTLSSRDFPDWDFPALPGAAAEARAVASRVRGQAWVGEAATRDRVLTGVQNADLIYLATHGVADRKAPLWDSFIALNQGPWTAVEVLTADLRKARLAVLSACQTGLGQDVDAGTIGLARSFYKSGVPRVVMSLWNVDDEGTQALMLSFLSHLEAVPPAEALRRAADDLRQQGASPAVWASFSMMGHPR
ncbi:MAG: CHAT domain-containing protein [Myxococcota bacterium]